MENRFNPEIHHRKTLRFPLYDYSQAGAYFVTVCSQDRECLFGEVRCGEVVLNPPGEMVQTVWEDLPKHYPHVELDEFVVMPNHLHGIVCLKEPPRRRGDPCDRPEPGRVWGEYKIRPYGTLDGTLGRVLQGFKSLTTLRYIRGVRGNNWTPFRKRLWQRNYYERMIRGERELTDIREYICLNPLKWTEDENHPDNL